jgi:hypothetical protein
MRIRFFITTISFFFIGRIACSQEISNKTINGAWFFGDVGKVNEPIRSEIFTHDTIVLFKYLITKEGFRKYSRACEQEISSNGKHVREYLIFNFKYKVIFNNRLNIHIYWYHMANIDLGECIQWKFSRNKHRGYIQIINRCKGYKKKTIYEIYEIKEIEIDSKCPRKRKTKTLRMILTKPH